EHVVDLAEKRNEVRNEIDRHHDISDRTHDEQLVDHRYATIRDQPAEQFYIVRQLADIVEHRSLGARAWCSNRRAVRACAGAAGASPCGHQSLSPVPPGSFVSCAGDDALVGVDGGGPGAGAFVAERVVFTSSFAMVLPVSSALLSTLAARFMNP